MEHKECVFSDYAIQRFAWLIYEGMKDERRKQIEAQKLYQRRVAPFAPYILARSVEDIKPYLTRIQMLF